MFKQKNIYHQEKKEIYLIKLSQTRVLSKNNKEISL